MTYDVIEKLRRLIATHYPDSQIEPVADDQLQSLRDGYPDIPHHLLEFYQQLGCGRIGRGRYMIHFGTRPDEIYDEQTAANLGNILIVGDNYAGDCDGYDIDHNWTFGSIDSSGQFVFAGNDYQTISEWLLYMLADD